MSIQKKYKIQAKKSLGQNFLEDDDILNQIVESTQVQGARIIEVGPGYGALSLKILQKKPQLFHALELDRDMISVLEDRYKKESWDQFCSDITIEQADVLEKKDLSYSSYKVIANIPYYITSPILHHFMYEVVFKPSEMTILMQKDVADKILKQYHLKKPKTSVLSLSLTKKSHIRKVCDVPAHCFSPQPKVDSSVLHFEFYEGNDETDDKSFLVLVKKSFSEPRKKLISNLVKAGYSKDKLEKYFGEHGIEHNLRPEDLSLDEYLNLHSELEK